MVRSSQSYLPSARLFKMAETVVKLVAVATILATANALSIPSKDLSATADARAQQVRETAARIQNEDRAWAIDGQLYPFCRGPVPRPGSLAEAIVVKETQLLKNFSDANADAYVAAAASITYKTVDDYLSFYDKVASPSLPRPMSTDISDETFGAQRLSVLGFTLKTATKSDYPRIFAHIPAKQVASVCGCHATVAKLGGNDLLFVSDFGHFGKWVDDKERATKYVPGAIGVFCLNEKKNQLLPLAIHIVDTKLTYTPFDRQDEWTLAKMALQAVELNFQQIWHFAETHATTSPIRVELMRNTAPSHPVNALLQHHFKVDSALEVAASMTLFNSSTAVDHVMAFGATGSMRYINHVFSRRLSLAHDFPADIKRLGSRLPKIHKYARYGSLHYRALRAFVRDYLRVYYDCDESVRGDQELQAWAKASATIPHLADFPEKFESLHELTRLVTHLIYTVSIKHHAMNGAVSWHVVTMPYSTPALWKPLPTHKLKHEAELNLAEYAIPASRVQELIGLVSLFRRDVPRSQSQVEAYSVEPFASEDQLKRVIAHRVHKLKKIESKINSQEDGQEWPYTFTKLIAVAAAVIAAVDAMSIPSKDLGATADARAQQVRDTATRIQNEDRAWKIDGQLYPFCRGPVPYPGSLAATIVAQENQLLANYSDTHAPSYVAAAASITYKTLDDYLSFYKKVESPSLPRPMSTDISDENFGAQRLSVLGFTLKTATASDYPSIFANITAEQASSVCGCDTTVAKLGDNELLFVSDFGTHGQWTDDKQRATKYAASAIGVFCLNEEKKQLLPLAIHIVDTKLTYTPFDREDEWTLAKMALQVVELNWQQIWHFAETHATTSPIRVELIRNTAPNHPVNALLQHHFQADSALEVGASVTLFNTSTAVDHTLAFGATGSMRYLNYLFTNRLSMAHDFPTDMERLGSRLPKIHKYAQYGSLHYHAIRAFVREYLRTYYDSDNAVRGDQELQAWAKASATIPHLADFPDKFDSLDGLVRLVTHLIHTVSIRHHAMNGAVSWQIVTMPYSTPALWKPLPTHKLVDEDELNLVEYTIPASRVQELIGLVSIFRRDVPRTQSQFEAYSVAPFTGEAQLAGVIARRTRALEKIESTINSQEDGQEWPYVVLRPSMLPYYSWI
ncbi:TPA: hypothetical protein N0F65_012542 [Lagenidium giganteum]|uniref:Lipoxygenase domain-containing protein n=1 Tax=Lagenidium giganteum TaxID=4803 RepID=A0AAV2YNC6_9STRA|nr:TPA: hypothetical protein N0F65_012542 [Lagenidium giganteum]